MLILTAVLSSACQAQQGPDTAPFDTESGVAERAEVSSDATEALPSPTQPPPDTLPAHEPTFGDPEASDTGIDDQPAVEQDREPDVIEAEAIEPDPLPAGLEAALRTSFGDAALVIHPELARGDLNGKDGDDIVVHVEARSADSPQLHLLVPVIDTGGSFDVQPPVELGHRIIVDTLAIRDGGIEVSYFDRSPYEPRTQITRRTTLSIDIDGEDAAGTIIRVEPIHNVPSLHITRPPVTAGFGLDGFGTAMADRIGLRERHPYVVHAAEDDVVVVTLEAPYGVWLEARLDDDIVLVPVAEQTQRFVSQLPTGGDWSVTVVSSLIEPATYRLSIGVFGAELGGRIATRDLAGFWSGTPISPPAVPDDGRVVYLTFDDGPHPTYTPQVLDVLARHGVQATFFVVGHLAEKYPLLIQRIAHEGHTLANHTWRHESLADVSRAAFDRSIGRTQEVLGPLATPCLRPPYWALGTDTEQWAAEHGLKLISWSYSPQDWLGPSARTIADGLVKRSKPGAVLLLHDGGGHRSTTVRGLDLALERLADSGLEFKAICR